MPFDWGNLAKKDDDPLNVKDALNTVKEIVTAPPDDDEVKTLTEHMSKIETDFNGISNIPLNHLYYDLRNRIQQLQNK